MLFFVEKFPQKEYELVNAKNKRSSFTTREIRLRHLLANEKHEIQTAFSMTERKANARGFHPSPGSVLLPSTIGIPARHGSPESRRRDPRLLWAPAISISRKTDQPLLTPQYQKRERRVIEKSEQIKLDPKVLTNADLSHLTRLGNGRTKLPISFLPHKINPSKLPFSVMHRGRVSRCRFL